MQEENTLMFVVDDNAKIIKGGKNMAFSELKKGMQVSVKYKKHRDKMIAVKINVLTKRGKES